MANMLIPVAERTLTPDQVEHLDRRRRRGHFLLNVGFQTLIVGTLVTLWAGQDLTYSPGWAHPIAYWNATTITLAVVFALMGINLRRGSNEFISY